jgi:ABC-2 type transport system ATP-binding protein
VDEVLAVGDAAFQDKCMDKFAQFRRAGKTVVIVSHAMGSMRTLCDQAAWLDRGRLVEVGRADHIVDRYVDKGHADAQGTSGDESGAAEARWGSGEVRITGISMLNGVGEPATIFHTGDEVTIRMAYECSQPVERPVFGLAMETVDGVYAWAHNTRDADIELPLIEGRGHVDLQIPRLMLQPQSFDLLASVVDHTTTHTYDILRHCYRFVVEPEPGSPRESGGILALGGQWSSEAATVPLPEALR